VHVDAEELEAYLFQFKSKLTKNGVGFFHHSNFGIYKGQDRANKHYRDEGVFTCPGQGNMRKSRIGALALH